MAKVLFPDDFPHIMERRRKRATTIAPLGKPGRETGIFLRTFLLAAAAFTAPVAAGAVIGATTRHQSSPAIQEVREAPFALASTAQAPKTP
jgi:hypothetical protein